MKLIDKNKLLEGLKSLKQNLSASPIVVINDVESLIENLEVKEVRDIWHDVSEKPELEQPLLIVMNGTHKDFRRHYRIGCYGKRANDIPVWVIDNCWSDSFISKWCYISDILKQTLEVEEVDLEKEFDNYTKDILACDVQFKPFTHLYNCAKYFFELGLKAQCKISYVPNIDDSLKELGVDPSSTEAKIFKESYYMALENFKEQKRK